MSGGCPVIVGGEVRQVEVTARFERPGESGTQRERIVTLCVHGDYTWMHGGPTGYESAAVIVQSVDPFSGSTSWRAIYQPMTADQRERLRAMARRWEREAIQDDRDRIGFPPSRWLA